MTAPPAGHDAAALPRPLPATYWVVPGRLLVGEHPVASSRADTVDRLSNVLSAGITCFIDLTEPRELPSYETLLPIAMPGGRRLKYVREPISDHGVPADREQMSRILAAIDQALEQGHGVLVHCRAGIGRSATVAGCWLAARPNGAGDPLVRLQTLWQQSVRSRRWLTVPETEAQMDFVRDWVQGPRVAPGDAGAAAVAGAVPVPVPVGGVLGVGERIRGALLGLAFGDATGAARHAGGDEPLEWTQHTALALCLAESLLETGRADARDQMDRYVRWLRDGHLSANGQAGQPTPDVARALATYQWRRKALAGSHDPADRTAASLPRVVTAVAFAAADPASAVALAGDSSRTTHQSPVVLDACRYYGAMLVGALGGVPAAQVLRGVYEPVAGLWARQPLRNEIVAVAGAPAVAAGGRGGGAAAADVVQALANARAAVSSAVDVVSAVHAAIEGGREPALDGALAGALAGALLGPAAIPGVDLGRLARVGLVEDFAARLVGRALSAAAAHSEAGS
jgi:ADP-ribosylglycohydrolase